MIYSRPALKEKDGIKVFAEDDFYWQVNISRDQIRRLLEALDHEPLFQAAATAGVNPGYIATYHRSDWIYFLPNRPRAADFRVLDLGAGFGNITIPLAKKLPAAKIYAADASQDILEVLAKQAKWENCHNIEAVKIGVVEELDLPFKSKSFDLILLNGVLEWIGAGVKTGRPRDHQVAVLRYLKSLLKDDGAIYIGIEGRFFPGYFMGVKDPHSQLRYTSVVPRRVADWLCRRAGKAEGYRTYTYSWRGYRQLFAEAGFDLADLETIYPVASYKDPFFLFRYGDRQAYHFAFTDLAKEVFPAPRGRFLFRTLYYLGLEKFFAPSYLFLLQQGKMKQMPRLLDQEIDHPNLVSYEPIKVFGNLGNHGSAPFWLIDKQKGRPVFVVKIKRLARGKDEVQVADFFPGKPLPARAESVTRAIALIKEFHQKNPGVIHGDYTLANILETEDEYRIIDWDDQARGQAQIFDVCSLILHYYLFLKKEPQSRIKTILLGPEALAWFQAYDPKIEAKQLAGIWLSFFNYSEAWYRERRPSKADFYHKLLSQI